MKMSDALSILGIEGQYTPAIVKLQYRKACAIYHPDRNPAGLEMMKMVNLAYDAIKEESGNHTPTIACYGQEINDALNAVIGLGFDIEICGSWVWLHGDTRPHKETIKAAGFMWAPKKMLWYYRPSDYKSAARGQYTMDDIRLRHGSHEVKQEQRKKIAA